ncbi:MAG: shikimate kinase [Lachnospiraceae bacterium]
MQQNIYLIGFMGTGKSTISHSLATILKYEEIDTDLWITQQQGKSVTEIFELYGEQYFRDLETECLKQMKMEHHKIISCGGGMVLRKENITLMKENGVVVLLTATPNTIFSRVKHGTGRPILNENMTVEYISELLQKRSPYYKAAGDITITTDYKSPEQISEEIKNSFDF